MAESARRRWLLLAVVSAGLLLITLDNSILYAALPTLVDRVGHRRMFLTGLLVFGAASLAAALSPTPEALIAARAFLAVGAAAMMPATLALIRVTFADERERNVAIAV